MAGLTGRGASTLLGVAVSMAVSGHAGATETPRFDGRDPYSLLDRHLQTRELRLQIRQPDQGFRLARDWQRFSAAGEVTIGTQQTYGHGEQTHFHGFAIADTFVGVELLPGLELTLNLLAFNPSASDGYRVSAVVKPGIALDAQAELFRIAGKPLRFGVTGTDLGVITLGEGLLFEQGRLEGVLGWLDYGDATLSYLYGGRSLWPDDDLIRWELSLLGRSLRFMFVEWQTKFDVSNPFAPKKERKVGHYADVALDLPLPSGFHLGAEYALRLSDPLRSAALVRSDWLRRDLGPFDVHVGYQFRFYEHGSGPRVSAPPPTVPFSFPYEEDTYATNPFEYLSIAQPYDQWSHTLMLEARLELGHGVELFGNEELWQRVATSFSRHDLHGKTASGFEVPGQQLAHFYSAGASYYPWRGKPHRADVMVTNKQVPGHDDEVTFVRFAPGRYYVLRLKALF